ncbi:hypothetical protein AAFN86_25525 [Roseomonas sp. CAU 1739]|uniref:hypothetical protein n=1 Tax=Roseomonas sp. CAU 1739 TaxID=3140364 RepID=UPI00325BB7BD
MARPPVMIDAWPLLPRPRDAGERPVDEPVQAAFVAAAGLAGLFLALRWALPGSAFAAEVAQLVALWGCLGGLALVIVLMSLLVGVAIVTPMMPVSGMVKDVGLAVFDHAVHLALVLTVAGVLGMIVLHGTIPGPAVWFAGQVLLLWGCHRTRLWLVGRSTA